MKRLFVFLLFLAVVGGAGWGVYTGMAGKEAQDKLKGAIDDMQGKGGGETEVTPPANTVTPPANLPTPANDVAKSGGEGAKKVENPPVKTAPPTLEGKAAETVLTAAEKLYHDALFQAAADKAQTLVSSSDRAIADRAASLAGRARACAEVLDDISESERTSAANIVDVVLMSGNPMRGTLLSDTPGEVTIRRPGGIVFKLSKSRVKEVVKLDSKTISEGLEAELASRLKKLSAPAATDYYDLAVYCYKNRLDARVGELLEKALDKDHNLAQSLRQVKAKNVYEAYVWFTGRHNQKEAKRVQDLLLAKYKDTEYAKMLQDTITEVASTQKAGGADPETKGDDAGGGDAGGGESHAPTPGGSAATREAVEQANKLYDEGMAHFEKSEPGAPNRREENKEAYQCFNKALDLYEQALSQGASGLERRLDEVRAIKVLTFRRQKALN